MIIIKKLSWSNAFSYGENNSIDFTNAPLTQIVGANGQGKSSIALILEEVLYNKNSKGIKKADIINRNLPIKTYTIELIFEKDNSTYNISTTRGATQTVKLLQNGIDISKHTSTATYAMIEDLIGCDHKTFAQIVYQSNSANLEFLSATDTNRKKFLIDLLNLNKYTKAAEIFKEVTKEVSDDVNSLTSKVNTIEAWINKYSKTSLDLLPISDVPEAPRKEVERVSEVKLLITGIEKHNKEIIQNNKYKEILESISLEDMMVNQPVGFSSDTSNYVNAVTEYNKTIKDAQAFINKLNNLGSKCPTCLQEIDLIKVNELVTAEKIKKDTAEIQINTLNNLILEINKVNSAIAKASHARQLFEQYHNLYDPKKPTELLSKDVLQKEISDLEKTIDDTNKRIKLLSEQNTKAAAHNATVTVIKEQLVTMNKDLEVAKSELRLYKERLSILQILIKTFSPTGLVAYKIECLIKDLEESINKYLSELSSGRFQLSFRIEQADKLNVIITDNGKDIEISALSSGEKARVNVATLLGIRRLMQSLSNNRINLLILDETIENLDIEGKEKLIEVLLSEGYLNTFIISHGFQHPLLEKIHVIKKNNISRIE